MLPLAFAGLCAGAPHAAVKQVAVKTPVQRPGTPVKKTPAKLSQARSVEISIPYPNAGMYLYRGIYGSFAGGRFYSQSQDSTAQTSWDDPLFQWQGEVSYFYTDWFSGGFGFKITAGNPSDVAEKVTNRYFLLGRFHKAWPKAAIFTGVSLGVDDVSLSLKPLDTLDFQEPLTETNAALGIELGGGWKFSRYVGATLGQRMDVSLVRQDENGGRSISFHTQPGIAIDLLRVTPALRENVKGFYLLIEMQFGQLLLDDGDTRKDLAWITGLSMAF